VFRHSLVYNGQTPASSLERRTFAAAMMQLSVHSTGITFDCGPKMQRGAKIQCTLFNLAPLDPLLNSNGLHNAALPDFAVCIAATAV